MILINKTFTEITPESAECGEFSDSGFIWENVPVSFKELIEYLETEFTDPSSSDLSSIYTWFSNDSDTDYYDMTETQESIHYSCDNPQRSAKYWIKAINYVFGK